MNLLSSVEALDKDSTLLLSPFIDDITLSPLLSLDNPIEYIDTTLEGFADPRQLTKYDNATLVHSNLGDIVPEISIYKMTNVAQLDFRRLHTLNKQELQAVELWRDAFTKHKDCTCVQSLWTQEHSKQFALYLYPHHFCTKEDILNLISKDGVIFSQIHKPRENHFGASECWRSLILLSLDQDPIKTIEALNKAFEAFSYRRSCF